MPSKIDFRDCVHLGIVGSTPEQILSAIHAECCRPSAALTCAHAPQAGETPQRTRDVELQPAHPAPDQDQSIQVMP